MLVHIVLLCCTVTWCIGGTLTAGFIKTDNCKFSNFWKPSTATDICIYNFQTSDNRIVMVRPFIVMPSVGSGQARNQNFSLGGGGLTLKLYTMYV